MVKTNLAYTDNRPLDVRRHFGGVGNGTSRPLSTDFGTLGDAQVFYPAATALTDETDWAALQSLVDESISDGAITTTRQLLRPIRVGFGDWMLNNPLNITACQDPTFRGEGDRTRLILAGVGLESILDLNGVANGTFSDFSFGIADPNTHTCTRALWLRWGPGGIGRSTTGNNFHNVTVSGTHYTKAGIEIGDSGNAGVQCDTDEWFGCKVYGDSRWHEAGDTSETAVSWWVGDGLPANNLLHSFHGCVAVLNKYGLYVDNTEAGWFGGIIQSMHDSDIYLIGPGYLTAGGFRSELSAALLKTGGTGGFAATGHLHDIKTQTGQIAANGRLIDWTYSGSLILENIVTNNPGPTDITIRCQPNGPMALSMTGVSVESRTLTEVLDVNSFVDANTTSYLTQDREGFVTEIESSTSTWVNPRTTLLEDAVAWWAAEDTDGTAWLDRNTGAVMTSITDLTKVESGETYDTNKIAPNDLVYFNGTTSKGFLPSLVADQPTDVIDATIAVWGTFYDTASGDRVLYDSKGGALGQWIQMRADGRLEFTSFGSTTIGAFSDPGVYDGVRCAIVLTIGGATLDLYVDGANVATVSRGAHDPTATNTYGAIGAQNGAANYAKAGIEGFAVWARVLTGAELAMLAK